MSEADLVDEDDDIVVESGPSRSRAAMRSAVVIDDEAPQSAPPAAPKKSVAFEEPERSARDATDVSKLACEADDAASSACDAAARPYASGAAPLVAHQKTSEWMRSASNAFVNNAMEGRIAPQTASLWMGVVDRDLAPLIERLQMRATMAHDDLDTIVESVDGPRARDLAEKTRTAKAEFASWEKRFADASYKSASAMRRVADVSRQISQRRDAELRQIGDMETKLSTMVPSIRHDFADHWAARARDIIAEEAIAARAVSSRRVRAALDELRGTNQALETITDGTELLVTIENPHLKRWVDSKRRIALLKGIGAMRDECVRGVASLVLPHVETTTEKIET